MLAMEGVCWLCQQELKVPRQGICSFCTKNLPPMPRVCPQCALTSEYIDASCGRCLLQPPPWQKLITVSPSHRIAPHYASLSINTNSTVSLNSL